jgi:hypothetical protein
MAAFRRRLDVGTRDSLLRTSQHRKETFAYLNSDQDGRVRVAEIQLLIAEPP